MIGVFEKKKHYGLKGMRVSGFRGYAPHFHTHGELIYVLRGQIPMVVDGEEFVLRQGQMLILFPYLVHSYEESPDAEVLLILFDPMETAFDNTLLSHRPVRNFVEGEALRPLLERVVHWSGKGKIKTATGYLNAAIGEFLELVPTVFSDRTAENTAVSILEYCDAHYAEDITVKSVSDALFVSPSYISKIFAQKLKYSFREYINSLRIHKAKALLANPNRRIVDVMMDCGFQNQSSFNRVFLEICGISPREYQKQRAQETKGL